MFLPRPLAFLGLAFFTVIMSARAQQPLPVPPPLPATAAIPGLPPPAERADVRIQFPNAQVTDILDQYQQLSGKHVIADNKVTGSMNLVVNSPVTRSEAIKIIEVALGLNGYSIVPGDGDIVKVLGLGGQPKSAGVQIYFDPSQIPNSDQIVAFLARLRYLDPLETAGVLQQFVPPASNVGFNAIPKAGALIITDNASHLKQLVALIAQIDLPAAPVMEKSIRLERADATKAVEFLNNVFELKASNTPGQAGTAAAAGANNAAVRRPIRRVGDDGQPIADAGGVPGFSSVTSNDFAIQGRATLTADVRTNSVYVVTSPVNFPRIEQLLQQYDADTPFAAPVRRPLKFVSAKDVLPILVQALTEPGSENSNGTNPTGTTGSNNQPRSGGTSGTGLSGSSNSNSTSSGIGSNGGSNSSIGQEGLDTQPVDTTPTEATVGNNKLIADQRNNTIILLGGQEAKDKVFEVLDQLDVRSPQVIIRTVIGELSLNDGKEFGLNYLLRSNRGSILSNFNASQLPTGAATPAASPSTGTSDTTTSALNTFTTLASGVASGFSGVGGIISIGRSFDIILSALESTSRFKTISRPMIFTSNNKKAIIASGQEIAVPTQSLSTTTGTVSGAGLATNVDYKDVTLQLEVVPLINSDHEITLDILQKIDNVVAGSSTTVGGAVVPTIATRYLKSTVSAPNNSTIVLGGLITEDDNVTDNAIPYLNKIPLIGKLLFTTHTRNADRNELIILMHPEVVNTDTLVKNVLPKEENQTYLGHDLEGQLQPLEIRKAIPPRDANTDPNSRCPPGPDDFVQMTNAPATSGRRRAAAVAYFLP